MIFNAPVIIRKLRISGAVNGGRQEQTRFFSFGKIRPPYNRTNVLFVKGESKCTVRGRYQNPFCKLCKALV